MSKVSRSTGKHGGGGSSNAAANAPSLTGLAFQLWDDYLSSTPKRLKLIDAYLVFIMLTGSIIFSFMIVNWLYLVLIVVCQLRNLLFSVAGAVQMLYCLLVGTFPFNSFLAGFISCVSSFVLAVSLRIQCNPENSSVFAAYAGIAATDAGAAPTKRLLPERAFADFLFAHLVLHLVVFNFLGWGPPHLFTIHMCESFTSTLSLCVCMSLLFQSRLDLVFCQFNSSPVLRTWGAALRFFLTCISSKHQNILYKFFYFLIELDIGLQFE